MKYLLVAHYAGFDLDDTEDLANNSWIVGEAETEAQAIALATNEIHNYIEEQVDSRFDFDLEDEDDYALDEILSDISKNYNIKCEILSDGKNGSCPEIRFIGDKNDLIRFIVQEYDSEGNEDYSYYFSLIK